VGAKKVNKKFAVWLTEEYDGFYNGSCLHVDKESKNFYYGIHSSMAGSFNAKFPKYKCTKTNPLGWISKINIKKT
jgi:hypothetical protein